MQCVQDVHEVASCKRLIVRYLCKPNWHMEAPAIDAREGRIPVLIGPRCYAYTRDGNPKPRRSKERWYDGDNLPHTEARLPRICRQRPSLDD